MQDIYSGFNPPSGSSGEQGSTQAVVTSQQIADIFNNIQPLADDGILSIYEKTVKLIPTAEELENTWQTLDDAAALSTSPIVSAARSAANTAHTNWTTYLSGLSPAWDNTGADTSVDRVDFNLYLSSFTKALSSLSSSMWGENTLKTSKLSVTGRVVDPTIYNTQNLIGPKNTTSLVPSYTVGASNVTINLGAHTRKIAGPSGPIVLSYGAMSGTYPFSTYWVAYIDDPNLTGFTSPVLNLSANPDDLLYPGRYHVASGVTPASDGSGGGTGTGSGGGGNWNPSDCVHYLSIVSNNKQAKDIVAGDSISVINETDWNSIEYHKVTSNKLSLTECVRLISETGISVIVSKSTPLTLKGGSIVYYDSILNNKLGVSSQDRGFRWEKIVKVEDVGVNPVSHIVIDNKTYGAGEVAGAMIFTHNPTYKL